MAHPKVLLVNPKLILFSAYRFIPHPDAPEDTLVDPVELLDPAAEMFCLWSPIHSELLTEHERAAAEDWNTREYGIDHPTLIDAIADAIGRFPDVPILFLSEPIWKIPMPQAENTRTTAAVEGVLRALTERSGLRDKRFVQDHR